MYITLTDINFQTEVLEHPKPVLVEFGADWCGSSHILAPIMEELHVEFRGQITIGKLDIDANEGIKREYGIRELPTLLFFKNGQVVDHIIGTVPKSMIAAKLSVLLETE